MNDKALLKRAERLHEEAQRIINDLGLITFLERISDPVLIGSAKNGLMVCKDIDLHAYMEDVDREKVLNILKPLGEMPTIQKVQFSNFKELRRDHLESKKDFPRGYYVGLRSIQPSGEWKIDIWFGKKDAFLGAYDSEKLLNIGKKKKVLILKIKDKMLKDGGGYKKGITAVDIYKAVYNEEVNSLEDFLKNKLNTQTDESSSP